jgi:cholesterol oxidase
MRSLSVGLDRLRDHYDVVVVGSGYGGAIAAARLAEAGRKVCVLERGREVLPGSFPRSLWRGLREIQWRRGNRRHGRRTGLFDVRPGRDISVLVGCGLGGTSLINAGVALRPPAWVFEDERWPAGLRQGGPDLLAPYFARAEEMLEISTYPEHWPTLPKVSALGTAADAVGGDVRAAPLAVSFQPGTTESGTEHGPCQLCGDCTSGCNYGAKNTVATNYLPVAVAHGTEVFTETEVRTILPAASSPPETSAAGWIVSFDATGHGRERFGAPSLFVHADVVVLAAGSLGTTEILFRSQSAGLAVSPRLGAAFSGNGDALAFAYGTDAPVRGLGLGTASPAPETVVGPCIAGMAAVTSGLPVDGGSTSSPGDAGPTPVRLGRKPLNGSGSLVTSTDGWLDPDDLLVQEGAVPGALRAVFPATAAFVAPSDRDGDGGPGAGGRLGVLRQLGRRLRRSAGALSDAGRPDGASRRILTYLLMGDDRGEGRLRPDGDGLEVEWTDAGEQPIFDRGEELLRKASAALGAELVTNPFASPTFRDAPITVHPLGGCAMADDGAAGVVDERGQVFDGEGTSVHDGLYVMDGAAIPRPLVVNPLLTISAMAERASALLIKDRGWEPPGPVPEGAADGPPSGHRTSAPERSLPGLVFTERMRGFLTLAGEDASADEAARRGRADGTSIEFVLTVTVDDLPALLADPSHPGRLSGTVVAPILSPRRLQVVDGSFVLVEEDPTHVDTWLMRYSMDLVAEDGRRYRFEGTKTLQDRAGLDAWSDATTLRVEIVEKDGEGDGQASAGANGPGPEPQPEPVRAKGVMTLTPGDFARQLTTMRVIGVPGRLDRLRWLARFDARFVRSLLKVYGGPLDDVGDLPAATRTLPSLTGAGNRRLRIPTPEPRWCDRRGRWHEGDDLGDDACLRLVRYEGGRRGPVLLAAGFSMAATSFLVDTIDTNLVEHLVEKGYDVWLFDYRASIDLPSADDQSSVDDIALHDWPLAVAEVLRVTGAGGVQAVAHCAGSATLMMSLAAGLSDVRSAVCMQFTLHPVSTFLNQIGAKFLVGKAVEALRVRGLAPLRGETLPNALMDLALRGLPMPRDERCGQAVCYWVNAVYGATHRHCQLNDATHDQLPDMFGVGNTMGEQHFELMMRRRAVVNAQGLDVYRAHPERLRLPLLLVQGAHNRLFHPEGSLRTLRWLQQANGAGLYERVVLPDYAHLDAVIGRDAQRDVFPIISEHLDRFNL